MGLTWFMSQHIKAFHKTFCVPLIKLKNGIPLKLLAITQETADVVGADKTLFDPQQRFQLRYAVSAGVLIYFGLTNTCVLAGFNWMPRACFPAFNLR